MNQLTQFKFVNIDTALCDKYDVSWHEMGIMVIISYFAGIEDDGITPRWCNASKPYYARSLRLSRRQIFTILEHLIERKYIIKNSNDPRKLRIAQEIYNDLTHAVAKKLHPSSEETALGSEETALGSEETAPKNNSLNYNLNRDLNNKEVVPTTTVQKLDKKKKVKTHEDLGVVLGHVRKLYEQNFEQKMLGGKGDPTILNSLINAVGTASVMAAWEIYLSIQEPNGHCVEFFRTAFDRLRSISGFKEKEQKYERQLIESKGGSSKIVDDLIKIKTL